MTPTPPYWRCKRFSLCGPSTPAYASLKKEVKDVVETSVDAPSYFRRKYDVVLVGTMVGGDFDVFSSQVYPYIWRYEVRAPFFGAML